MLFESPAYWIACVLGNILLLGYLLHNLRHRLPVDGEITATDEILYQEYFASGRSLRDWLTSWFLGARNCLEVKVTEHALYICPVFPFSMFALLFDLEHYIPKSRITSFERTTFLFDEGLNIEYARPDDTRSRFWLRPRSLDDVHRAVTSPPVLPRAAS